MTREYAPGDGFQPQ